MEADFVVLRTFIFFSKKHPLRKRIWNVFFLYFRNASKRRMGANLWIKESERCSIPLAFMLVFLFSRSKKDIAVPLRLLLKFSSTKWSAATIEAFELVKTKCWSKKQPVCNSELRKRKCLEKFCYHVASFFNLLYPSLSYLKSKSIVCFERSWILTIVLALYYFFHFSGCHQQAKMA